MRTTTLNAIALHFLIVGKLAAGKRGGGGGWGGGDYTSGGSGGGDDGDDSSSGSGYTPPPPAPPCDQGDCVCDNIQGRMNLYELPGFYYNGTVTIHHLITSNSAWDVAAFNHGGGEKCDANNDNQPKTYSYPALFLVGPTGNSSDTNPIFWELRGYQPPDQFYGDEYLNMAQDWIHIRSSDFVVTDDSLRAYYGGQYEYFDSDSSGYHQETTVYWDTAVSHPDALSEVFDASAKYITYPSRNISMTSGGVAAESPKSSQYVTLSDVCYYDQEPLLGSGSVPPSNIPKDNNHFWTTTPTIFFSTGADAKISNIGGDSLTFQTNISVDHGLAFSGQSASSCLPMQASRFYRSFGVLQWTEALCSQCWLWNMTVAVRLEFAGDIVRENSTAINGTTTDGTPVFVEQYERGAPMATTTPTSMGAVAITSATLWALVASFWVLTIVRMP